MAGTTFVRATISVLFGVSTYEDNVSFTPRHVVIREIRERSENVTFVHDVALPFACHTNMFSAHNRAKPKRLVLYTATSLSAFRSLQRARNKPDAVAPSNRNKFSVQRCLLDTWMNRRLCTTSTISTSMALLNFVLSVTNTLSNLAIQTSPRLTNLHE